jgi:DNA-binding MarR family transcriptional regulator
MEVRDDDRQQDGLVDQAANLLGATALAVADRQAEAVVRVAGDASSAAALNALHEFLDAPSVDLLRQVLGLTHSGTVRLLDRLEAQELVIRAAGPDARTASVHLTRKGRAAARRVGAARAAVLDEALSPFDERQRAALGQALGELLSRLVREPGVTRWTCRLCDTTACGRAEDRCPMADEAQHPYG